MLIAGFFAFLYLSKVTDMPLIKSISGIRGTIGGIPGSNLTPLDIVKFTGAFGTWIKRRNPGPETRVIVGRDGRKSGRMVSNIVITTFQSLGIDVTDLDLSSTPTVEMAVTGTMASGGVIITASHNPSEWNALKLLNERGEFLSAREGNDVLRIADEEDFDFVTTDRLGKVIIDSSWNEKHIDAVLGLKRVDKKGIRAADLKVVVDCINSVGGIILPDLLSKLGVRNIIMLNDIPDGNFAHNPEPVPGNLREISEKVISENADVGFVVDPDVDRLAIICEDGSMFGEEYTLVSVADYILSFTPGNTVSNMSSTKALKDITEKHGAEYFSSAVGEVNVVEEMKRRNAIIGGEGNGGVIYPELHYGRDALVGIALFLSRLAGSGLKCSELRKTFPDYSIIKEKITLHEDADVEKVLEAVKSHFHPGKIDERDGIRVEDESGWVHIRKSNTEPIIRIYAEDRSEEAARRRAGEILEVVKKL